MGVGGLTKSPLTLVAQEQVSVLRSLLRAWGLPPLHLPTTHPPTPKLLPNTASCSYHPLVTRGDAHGPGSERAVAFSASASYPSNFQRRFPPKFLGRVCFLASPGGAAGYRATPRTPTPSAPLLTDAR